MKSYWEVIGNLLKSYWGAIGKLLASYWQVVEQLFGGPGRISKTYWKLIGESWGTSERVLGSHRGVVWRLWFSAVPGTDVRGGVVRTTFRPNGVSNGSDSDQRGMKSNRAGARAKDGRALFASVWARLRVELRVSGLVEWDVPVVVASRCANLSCGIRIEKLLESYRNVF